MRNSIFATLTLSLVAVMAAGCAAKQQKAVMEDLQDPQPVNCATAQGDIRVLESEKAHVAQRILEGATAILPAGLVIGILTGTEKTKLQVAVGTYNEAIENRIGEIKQTCGLD